MAHGGGLALRVPLRKDVLAGLLTVVVSVLAGPPVGLLWAALAPHVDVVVVETGVTLADAHPSGFIAADGYYLAAVVVAGTVGGWLSWRLASAHAPAVVVGLAVGGTAAAWLAARVGGTIGDTALELAAAGVRGPAELGVELLSTPAIVGWPLAALATHVGAALAAERRLEPG